ncbi:hypothetical protein WJX81_006358 [Elliptochloris bilobata]|uniref:Succinate dehydrogenase subunit C n=1 Tax=Elliptochloris bilobata TaxID=381761 RepID=A0AAW1S5R4_9CHLO
MQHIRAHGGGVPEFWGKDSPYHPGTGFLGTPPDHLERVAKRPVSPHVFEIDGKGMHYKFPINATTSIMNRVTGTVLTLGTWAAGAVALQGDLVGAVDAFKAAAPALVLPAKFAVAFPLVYHYLGGARHVFWDKSLYGNMAKKDSPLENPMVDRSSQVLVWGSVVGTLAVASVSLS